MLKCDACGNDYDEDDADFPMVCEGCHKRICEGCEVMRCEERRHDCPLCGAMLGECHPASEP